MLDIQLLAIALTAVLVVQHFPQPTNKWEAIGPALKTWATWKIQYCAAHSACKQQLLAAGLGKPLNCAHAVTSNNFSSNTFDKLDGYLDNLTNAAVHKNQSLPN